MVLLHLKLLVAALLTLILLALFLYKMLSSRSRMQRQHKSVNPLGSDWASLQTYEGRYQAIRANAPIVLSAIDVKGNFVFADGHGLSSLGQKLTYNRIGRSVFEIYQDYPAILSDIRRALGGEEIAAQYDIDNCIFKTQVTPMRGAKGQVMGVIILGIDVTEQVRAEQALWHQAHYDTVTDLPNQTLLRERVVQALQEDKQASSALFMLDLSRFREINDTFGYQYGNYILQQVGKRLSCALAPSATIARADGDEVIVFLPKADEEKAQEAVAVIGSIFEQPFLIEEFPLYVEASIGIAISSSTQEIDFLDLLRHADVAMHIARSKRKAYVFYRSDLDPYTPRRLSILGALRTAIEHGELTLFYQPQIDLQTGITHSVEALVRWNHPEYGCIPPDQFIPLAEQTGLIKPLTSWVLEAAIQQCVN